MLLYSYHNLPGTINSALHLMIQPKPQFGFWASNLGEVRLHKPAWRARSRRLVEGCGSSRKGETSPKKPIFGPKIAFSQIQRHPGKTLVLSSPHHSRHSIYGWLHNMYEIAKRSNVFGNFNFGGWTWGWWGGKGGVRVWSFQMLADISGGTLFLIIFVFSECQNSTSNHSNYSLSLSAHPLTPSASRLLFATQFGLASPSTKV